MRKQSLIFFFILCVVSLSGCKGEKPAQPLTANQPQAAVSQSGTAAPAQSGTSGKVTVSFPFIRQAGNASNQFAVWVEDKDGKYVKTLFVTDFTVQGGYKTRREALMTWVERAKLAGTPVNDIDAVSGATPKTGNLIYTWDLLDYRGKPVSEGNYKFFVEGTLFWESNVLFSGAIDLGDTREQNVTAEAQYSAQTEKNKDMIKTVTAVYTP